VRKSIFGLKKNLSQNRLLKWYSTIDELLTKKDDEDPEDPEGVFVKSADETSSEQYVLGGN